MIILTRRNSYVDKFRKYELIIDGKKCGKIRNNSEIKINLTEGTHTLYLLIDWCKSNELVITINENEDVLLECYPNSKGKSIFKNLFSFLNNTSHYIVLDWKSTI